ncbi:MAG: SDR family oxidoreductase [Cyanothece sp. SIO2G6]|nr:SDR family oxidoreductase [Cyanothece sp. SIO2G6]
MGLTFAHHLAQTVQAKLVLCGRSAFPQPPEWSSWLDEHDDQDPTSQKIRRLMEMERLGADIMIAQADVSQLTSMQELVERVRHQWGEIQGVLHAAGLVIPGNIASKTPELMRSVFAPKVDGLMVLEDVFQSVNLDFLALFSSLSSISGGSAVDYVAVNHFLDTYANSCAHQMGNGSANRLTIALNWDTWQMTYQEANVSEDLRLFYERNQEANIGLDEGVKAFDRILRQTFPQVVISSKDLQVAIQQHRTAQRLEVVDTLSADLLKSTDGTQKSYPRPNLRNAYVMPSNDVEQIIAQFWQKFLGIEPIGIHDNFFALGGDSLVGSILVNQLRDHFQIELPVQKLFECPTISELAVLVEDILIQEVATLDEQEAEQLLAQV